MRGGGRGGMTVIHIILEWTKLVCTPASTALFAFPGRVRDGLCPG